MWLFKRKRKEEIKSKFKVGDEVVIFYQNDRKIGFVYRVYKSKDNVTLYEVNIMGQCPYILKDIKEEELTLKP